jgi:hypothetical protein
MGVHSGNPTDPELNNSEAGVPIVQPLIQVLV